MLDDLRKSFFQLAMAEVVVPPLLTHSERGALNWLRHRLRSMEAAEVVTRTQEVLRHAALAVLRRWVASTVPAHSDSAGFRFDGAASSLFEGIGDGEMGEVLAEAEKWAGHRASFFGLRDVSLGDAIDWHRDYSSGLAGPMKFSALINHRNAAEVGDVKYIWELNRLQHLILLSLASAWTRADAYENELREQIRSWSEQNPFMIGLNWKSPLEAGLRLVSWALSFLAADESSRRDLVSKEFLQTLYQHQYFIAKFYSKHSSANNHLIGEMAGLYVAAAVWPHFRESNSWRSLARRKLIEEITRQVEEDGVGKERATEYQLFILEFFILAGALGHAIGDEFPAEYWHRIGRMAAFLAAISDRNGNMPMFGDGDSGQVLALPQSEPQRLLSLLRIFRRSGADEARDRADLRSRILLWGQDPKDMPLPAECEPNRELQQFPQGGYYVLANHRGADDEVIVVFDAGPMGFAPLYAHGHADALSFCLSYGGREFLVDPGTFTYYTQEKWREYFRSTAAHNTVRIDGVDQSVPGGRFLWRQVARCSAQQVQERPEYLSVTGSHDGYGRLSDPVIHRRSLSLDKKTRVLTVTDFLDCRGNHDVEIFFHFSEHCQVQQVAPNLFSAVNGERKLSVQVDRRFQPTLCRGSEQPIAGWLSRRFGVKEPSYTLIGKAGIDGPARFVSEISPQ